MPSNEPPKILVSGSSGLIGSALCAALDRRGFEVRRIKRSSPGACPHDLVWDLQTEALAARDLEGFKAIIHLAGESLVNGRWSSAKKRRIRDSRVISTSLLSKQMALCERKPSVFICASAIGYYGSRDQMLLSEEAEPGTGFLADVTKAWEQAAKPADQAGIRTVNLRTGIVLSRQGGALKKMLLPFLLGAGGIIGSGEQYMSWIELDDQIRAILHLLDNTQISGPVNLVSPNPVTNREFTKTLGMVLKRPAFFAVPEFAVRLAFGEMGEETILASAHVSSKKLQESGFSFDHPGLEDALRHALAA